MAIYRPIANCPIIESLDSPASIIVPAGNEAWESINSTISPDNTSYIAAYDSNYCFPTSADIINGTEVNSYLSANIDIVGEWDDARRWQIHNVGTGIQGEIHFSSLLYSPTTISIDGYFYGTEPTSLVSISIWDNVLETWEPIGVMVRGYDFNPVYNNITFHIPANNGNKYISAGAVILQFYSSLENTHDSFIVTGCALISSRTIHTGFKLDGSLPHDNLWVTVTARIAPGTLNIDTLPYNNFYVYAVTDDKTLFTNGFLFCLTEEWRTFTGKFRRWEGETNNTTEENNIIILLCDPTNNLELQFSNIQVSDEGSDILFGANAGPDRTIFTPTTISLDGFFNPSGYFYPPILYENNGTIPTIEWTVVSGDAAIINDAMCNTWTPNLRIDRVGTIIVQLRWGYGESGFMVDTITIAMPYIHGALDLHYHPRHLGA